MITLEESRRLALAKYLLRLGVGQSRQPEPLCSIALLSLHDATELFLQLAAEHVDAKTSKNTEFLGYWDAIQNKLDAKTLPKRESMKQLNAARVSLKHHGVLPARAHLGEFSMMVEAFFAETAQIVFDVEFDSISLADFIDCEECRLELKRAEACAIEDEHGKGLTACAKSLDSLVRDYEDRKRERFGRSPFLFGDDMSFSHGFSSADPEDLVLRNRGLQDFALKIERSIGDIQRGLKILSMGLDYRKYSKFRLLTPMIFVSAGGERLIAGSSSKGTRDDLSFCIDFVLESALDLQAFDYDHPDAEDSVLSRTKSIE